MTLWWNEDVFLFFEVGTVAISFIPRKDGIADLPFLVKVLHQTSTVA
jgi:hypothetical protein